MKTLQFLCLFVLILVATFGTEISSASNPGMGWVGSNAAAESREVLEEDVFLNGGAGLKDYFVPMDPVPDLKRSIHHGPIQHDNPLFPYIPKPSPAPSCGPHSESEHHR